jgi:hypothetical protein
VTAARRLLPILLFAVLPLAVAIGMFATASSSNSLAADFMNELYPEAKLLPTGRTPSPAPTPRSCTGTTSSGRPSRRS